MVPALVITLWGAACDEPRADTSNDADASASLDAEGPGDPGESDVAPQTDLDVDDPSEVIDVTSGTPDAGAPDGLDMESHDADDGSADADVDEDLALHPELEDELGNCGGARTHPAAGSPCGLCRSGTRVCTGPGTTTCVGEGGDEVLDVCGGCFGHGTVVGNACGACGAWQCVDAVMTCVTPEEARCRVDYTWDDLDRLATKLIWRWADIGFAGHGAVGDLNDDGHLDVVGAANVVTAVAIWMGPFEAGAEPAAQMGYTIDTVDRPSSTAVAVGDVNNDGLDDLLIWDRYWQGIAIMFGPLAPESPCLTFSPWPQDGCVQPDHILSFRRLSFDGVDTNPFNLETMFVVDLDQDGSNDIVVSDPFNEHRVVFAFGPLTEFTEVDDELARVGSFNPRSSNDRVTAIADVNQDGFPDFSWETILGSVRVILGPLRSGLAQSADDYIHLKFGHELGHPSPFLPRLLDTNRDGQVDVVVPYRNAPSGDRSLSDVAVFFGPLDGGDYRTNLDADAHLLAPDPINLVSRDYGDLVAAGIPGESLFLFITSEAEYAFPLALERGVYDASAASFTIPRAVTDVLSRHPRHPDDPTVLGRGDRFYVWSPE